MTSPHIHSSPVGDVVLFSCENGPEAQRHEVTCPRPPSSSVGEVGFEALILAVFTAHQLVRIQGIGGEWRRQAEMCWGVRVSIFYHVSLSVLSTFSSSSPPPLPPLVELSPGAPALFSEAAAHLKKLELETVKAAGPWPALHININKVPGTRAG